MFFFLIWKMFRGGGRGGVERDKRNFLADITYRNGGGFFSQSKSFDVCVCASFVLFDRHTHSYHLNSVKSMWTSRELGGSLQPQLLGGKE